MAAPRNSTCYPRNSNNGNCAELGVGRVILGAAGRKGVTVPGERGRLHRKEHEEIVLEQRGDDGPLAELETDRYWSATKALSELLRPDPDGSRLVLDDGALPPIDACHGEAHVVLFVGPIQANECGEERISACRFLA